MGGQTEGPALGRRERHKADKRQRITSAARARFAAAGYAATTTAQIAQDADVAAGTLFQYAASKAELLMMAMNDEVSACLDAGARAAGASAAHSREHAVMAFFAPLLELAATHEENFSVLVREVLFGPPGRHRDAALALVHRVEDTLRELLATPPEPAIRPGADLINAARALVFAMLLEISSTRLGLHPETGTADRIRAQLDLVLHGILSQRSEPTPGRRS